MDTITVRVNGTIEYRGTVAPYANASAFIAENRNTSDPEFAKLPTLAISFSENTQSPLKRAELIAAHSAAIITSK